MSAPLVVIITGPPGAGKTTLGRRLAYDLGVPFLSKDAIKDILFERLGWKDRQWSKDLGRASFDLLFHFADCLLEAGASLVVETAFMPEFHNGKFEKLQNRHKFRVAQVYCMADKEVLFRRFSVRAQSSQRHPGHVDHMADRNLFIRAIDDGTYGALAAEGALFPLDTTDFAQIGYERLRDEIIAIRSGESRTRLQAGPDLLPA